MKSKARVLKFVYGFLILFPLMWLGIWMFAGRWPWPDLWPAHFSDRSLLHVWSQRKRWGEVITQAVAVSMGVGFLSTAIALLVAEALSLKSRRQIKRWTTLAYLPVIIPSTIFAMGIQSPLLRWGLGYTYFSLIIVHLIYSLPYAIFLVLDFRLPLGRTLEDVAYTMGASPFQAFWRVTFPQLKPILLTAWMMAYIISFSQYFLTLVIGGGRLQTLATLIFPYIEGGDRSLAAAFSFIFISLNVLIFLFFQMISRSYQKERGSAYEVSHS